MSNSAIIPLLTAFGLGSITTSLIQSDLTTRSQTQQRNFEERKSAYIGLLEAYHRVAVEGTEEAGKNFAIGR